MLLVRERAPGKGEQFADPRLSSLHARLGGVATQLERAQVVEVVPRSTLPDPPCCRGQQLGEPIEVRYRRREAKEVRVCKTPRKLLWQWPR